MQIGLILLACLAVAQKYPIVPPSFGARAPPGRPFRPELSPRLCAGPGALYPVKPDIVYSSVFDVPELPKSFDMTMTYYNYFNVYFDHQNPPGGHFNQFVPQLMLGTALANSSGPPNYTPQWLPLRKWYIGSQYFMEFNEEGLDQPPYRGAAVTGKLLPVEPGESIITSFSLSADGQTWTLHMGVIGGGPERTSIVVADKPFMGLLKTTKSWTEYNSTMAGACWENYGLQSPESFPPGWSNRMTIAGDTLGNWWQNWTTSAPNVSWVPHSSVTSRLERGAATMAQYADWEIYQEVRRRDGMESHGLFV